MKNNLIKAAEKMSDKGYAFKATPEVRTFGGLMGHIADSQIRTCSLVLGDAKQPNASSRTAKAELVAAIKEAFATCDAAWDSMTDATAVEMFKFRNAQKSKLGALILNTTHDNEEYGSLSVYMRLTGVVPPSSDTAR